MEEKEKDIPKEYKDFNNQVFNKAIFEKLPDQSKWDHAIELIPNAILKDYKIYPLNIKEQEELNKFLKEYLKLRWIWPSKSSYMAPLSQMVTYLFVIGALEFWKVQKCKV